MAAYSKESTDCTDARTNFESENVKIENVQAYSARTDRERQIISTVKLCVESIQSYQVATVHLGQRLQMKRL